MLLLGKYFQVYIMFLIQQFVIADNSTIVSNCTINLLKTKFKENWPVEDWIGIGLFTDSYIDYINSHWLEFPPPHSSSFYILGILYFFIMIFGIFGNLIVIYLYLRCKSLRTDANTLIINLAVSDCLMMCKIPLFIFNCIEKGPVLGDFICRIYGFIGGLTGTVSICILASISLDRYFVIKFPLSRQFSTLRVKISIITSWLYGIIFSIIPVLDIGLGKYTPEGYLISCSFDYLTKSLSEKIFIFVFFIAAWLIPFLLITFSYVNIVQVVVKRSNNTKKERDSFRHVKEEDTKRQEIKLALIVLCVIFMWFTAWTPYAVVSLLGIFNQTDLITPISSMIPALFCKTASAIDPYVYALSHPKFKEELKKLFNCNIYRESNRVWTTDSNTKVQSFEKNKDVEEETVEIDLKKLPMVDHTNKENKGRNEIDFSSHEAKLKKETSISKLLCLQPNFSNRSSSIRKMARRWSMKERDRKEEE